MRRSHLDWPPGPPDLLSWVGRAAWTLLLSTIALQLAWSLIAPLLPLLVLLSLAAMATGSWLRRRRW